MGGYVGYMQIWYPLVEVLESIPGKYWQTVLHLKIDTHFQVSEAFHLFECLFWIKNSIYEPTSLQKMRLKKDSFRKKSIFHVTIDQNVPSEYKSVPSVHNNLFVFFLLLISFYLWSAAAAAAKSLQSCPTLYDPIDGSLPGPAVPGILQARTLEWVAISSSNAWKWKVKVKSLPI